MLNNAFKDQQHNSLQDYIEVSTMLRYNYRKNVCFKQLRIIIGIGGEYWNNFENNRGVEKELLERIIGNLKA